MSKLADKRHALFARLSDGALIEALSMIHDKCKAQPSAEHRMTHAWLIEEAERRFPDAAAGMEALFMADDAAWQAYDGTGEPPADIEYIPELLKLIKI